MYCVVWRHYSDNGLIPYVVSKFPDEEEAREQPELAPLVNLNAQLRPLGTQKSLGGKDTKEYRALFNKMLKAGNIITCKIIDIDYNIMEDIIVFNSKQSAETYMKTTESMHWTKFETEIVLQKEIEDLKELSAFQ